MCSIYIIVLSNSFLRTSQLVKVLRSEHRVSHNPAHLDHLEIRLRGLLSGPSVATWWWWCLNYDILMSTHRAINH